MAEILEIRNLEAGYRGKALLGPFDLKARRGEITALAGPNGSGKSTILKTLAGEIPSIGGQILLDGRDLLSLPGNDRAKRMAVVLTDRPRTELMSAYEVAAAGRYPHTGRMGFLTREDEEKVEEALRLVDAAELGPKDFTTLSDGQKQRILLARAICQEPELLVLDEPTSFLDIRYKIEFLTILRYLAKERGLIVLLSLHEIDLVQKAADKVVFVDAAHRVRYGTAEEMFSDEAVRTLFDIRIGSYDILSGSIELPRTEGTPRVLVLSSGGRGIPVYRRLQRENIPFAALVPGTDDADYRTACYLAAEVLVPGNDLPGGEQVLARALRLADSCGQVIDAGDAAGTSGDIISRVREEAEKRGILI